VVLVVKGLAFVGRHSSGQDGAVTWWCAVQNLSAKGGHTNLNCDGVELSEKWPLGNPYFSNVERRGLGWEGSHGAHGPGRC
jgi:hypothetical protein